MTLSFFIFFLLQKSHHTDCERLSVAMEVNKTRDLLVFATVTVERAGSRLSSELSDVVVQPCYVNGELMF